MGFSADLDLKGAGSSLSVNGSKTDLNADYKGVGEQSGIFANEADLVVEGKGTFTGAVFTTSEEAQANGKSNIVFKQGVTATDLKNTTSYDGDAIQAGISIGSTNNKPQASMNGIGYGTDSDSDSSVTRAGITGVAGNKDIITDNRAEYAGILENSFDANRVNKELGAQTQITQEFGKEAPKAVAEFSQNRMDAIRANPNLSADEKMAAISKWDEGGIYRVAAHTVLGALGTGSVEGALTTGGVAAAAPTLDDVQAKLAKALIDKGMSEDIANGAASGVVSLTLLGAGTAAGLDTSSTVTATNVDANNRQLHINEIRFLNNSERVKRFQKYILEKEGKSISKEEAQKRLNRSGAALVDNNWNKIYGGDGNALSFIASEAQKSGMKITSTDGKTTQIFHVDKSAFNNETINLRQAIQSYANPQTQQFIKDLQVKVNKGTAIKEYKAGQSLGYQDAGKDANPVKDTGIILSGLLDTFGFLIESTKSDQVGPIDSQRMKEYHNKLLQLQGKYKEAGYLSEKDWAETQRLTIVGLALSEVGGVALGAAAKAGANTFRRIGNGNTFKTLITSSDDVVESTAKGFINATKVRESKNVLNPTNKAEKNLVDDIIKNSDQGGTKTEKLINSISSRSGFTPVKGGTYNKGVNGFDHVLLGKDGTVVIVDSKQISKSGTLKVEPRAAGNTNQLSPAWIDTVRGKLPPKDPARVAIENAIKSNKPIKTVITAVDKQNGVIKIIPVKIPNKK
ncbi:hypothetical protein [Psychrobacter piscatorii]|uniref:hypothetical protein n=1 Tax=Psychrobacter piscatorii TaxID=554343 RepID=UPI0037367293